MNKQFAYPKGPIPWQAAPHDFTGDYNLNIYTTETTQRFALGTRYETWDGRVFRYARAGSNRTTGYAMSFNSTKFAGSGASTSDAVIASATVVGGNTVDYTVTAAQGYDADGSLAKDVLCGGFIVVLGETPAHQFRQIVANTAVVSGGGTTTITVESPWAYAEAAATTCCIWGNPYYDVREIAEDYISAAGVPVVNVTTGQFFWMQTWGPCRTSGHSATAGIVAGERQVWFGPNGNFRSGDTDAMKGTSRQLAGFYIERTSASAGAGYNPLVMLQISP